MTEKLPSPFLLPEVDAPEASAIPDPALELIGLTIGGRYRITRIVGQGGMGVVYGGEHLELGLEVAIKVLPAMFARDQETLKRFEREARTASRVRHSNVVTVFDLGRLETGEPYLVMEMLVGRDLEQVVEGGKILPLREVIAILEPLAGALDALHKEGVVHRDIKPSNIFFSQGAGGIETVKLVDFGIAALHRAGEKDRLTRAGFVVGTAVYMAPEGARGALVGPSGDIYSLGVMAFELLAGAPPFDGPPMEVLFDKVSKMAPSLAEISGRPFDARLEGALAAVLSRTPEECPSSAIDFVKGLKVALKAGASAQTDPPPGLDIKFPPRADATGAMGGSDVGTGPTLLASALRDSATAAIPKLPISSRGTWVAVAVVLLLATVGGGIWSLQAAPAEPIAVATPRPAPAIMPETFPADELPTATAPPSVAVTPVAAVAAVAPVAGRRGDRTHAPVVPARSPSSPRTVEGPTPAAPEAPSQSTDRTAALLRDASSAMLHGEIPRARDLYREATLASPSNGAAWRGLGLSSERLGLVPEARRAYTRYLEIAPTARDAATVRERLQRLGS